jgi:transcriptional antiterminator NusG
MQPPKEDDPRRELGPTPPPPEPPEEDDDAPEVEASPEAEPQPEPQPSPAEEAPPGNRRWYVIRVQTGREDQVRKAIERLKASRNLEDKIGEIVVPTEPRLEQKAGRRHVRQHKLYPGYVFVNMELSNDTWFAIRETPGVGDFLGLKDPIAVRQEEVDRLLRSIRQAEEKPKIKVTFQQGDLVRVKDGVFENFEGTVEGINERKGLVKVSFVIFGRPTNVELEYWQLEKV